LLQATGEARARVVRLERAIEEALPDWSLAPTVTAVMAMRGFDLVAATTILSEAGDLGRFETPRQLMAWLGLVPSEASTGDRALGAEPIAA
jgi:transposase